MRAARKTRSIVFDSSPFLNISRNIIPMNAPLNAIMMLVDAVIPLIIVGTV